MLDTTGENTIFLGGHGRREEGVQGGSGSMFGYRKKGK